MQKFYYFRNTSLIILVFPNAFAFPQVKVNFAEFVTRNPLIPNNTINNN